MDVDEQKAVTSDSATDTTVTEESVPSTKQNAAETQEPSSTEQPESTSTKTPEHTGPEPESKKIAKELIASRKAKQEAEQKARDLEIENRVLRELKPGVASGANGVARQAEQPSVKTSGPPERPDPDDFEGAEYSDEYADAFQKYNRDIIKYELRQEEEQKAKDARQRDAQEVFQKSEKAYQNRINLAAEEDPELLIIQDDKTLPMSIAMGAEIKQSEVSPKLLRYLADHRDEARRIFDLCPSWMDPATGQIVWSGDPRAVTREMTKLEAKLLAAASPAVSKTKIISAAPEPIQTVSDHGVGVPVVVLDDNTPTVDFIRERNRREAAARKLRR